MHLRHILFAFAIFVGLSQSMKPSLLNPPWKHCVHRKQAKKSWQVIVSPGYPHGIRTQTQCSWIITALPPRKVKLAFQTLNLTGSINNCYTQFIEFWEIKQGTSMGKFCGDRRPGDYVTYGSQIRVDLKADTAAAGHEGFMLKYKLVREPGGFKQTHTFSKSKPKKKTQPAKPKKSSDDSEDEDSSPSSSNGGRVNLAQLQRLRQQLLKKKTPEDTETGLNQDQPQQQAPVRSIQTPRNRPPSFQNNEINVSFRDGDEVTLQLWIIVLIGVGGFLFLLLVGVVGWLCICRKRRNNKSTPTSNENSSLPKRKSPLDATVSGL